MASIFMGLVLRSKCVSMFAFGAFSLFGRIKVGNGLFKPI